MRMCLLLLRHMMLGVAARREFFSVRNTNKTTSGAARHRHYNTQHSNVRSKLVSEIAGPINPKFAWSRWLPSRGYACGSRQRRELPDRFLFLTLFNSGSPLHPTLRVGCSKLRAEFTGCISLRFC